MNLSQHHPVLLAAVPLVFAALCPLVGMWKRKACFPWSLAGVAFTGFLAWTLIGKVNAARPLTYDDSGWPPPWGIQIRIDPVGLLLACIITSVGLLLVVYSWRYAEHELKPERIPYYYTLLLLVFTAMLGFSITGDLFNLFVFMEIFSIASYALVAIGGEPKALRAALKYLFMGAASSLTVLLAIALLYSVTGSLNMADISSRLARLYPGYLPVAAVALILFVIGFSVKAALFPVHMWLPEAHSIAPSSISALLSALVIKMGVLGIIRVLFTVYGRGISESLPTWGSLVKVLAWAGALSVVIGAVMAIIQRDLKVMIAYSSVAHIGYMVMGVAVLSTQSVSGGLYNVLAHAMGKGCFFLVAGCIIYKHGLRRIQDMRGIGRRMPITAGAFTLASLSIVGFPPSAGFIAKWDIIYGCFQKSEYALAVMGLLGSLLSAVYCFRVVYYMFFTGGPGKVDEVPVTMYAPPAILALGTLFFGIFPALVMPYINQAARVLLSG